MFKLNDKVFLFLSNIAFAAFQWGILLFIARFIGFEAVGLYSIITMISAPVFLFFNMQLRVRYVTDPNNVYDFNIYFNMRLTLLLVALLITCMVGLFFKPTGFSINEYLVILIIFSFYKVLDGLFDITYARYQKDINFGHYAKSLTIRSLLGFLFLIISTVIYKDLIITLFFLLISQIVVLFNFDIKIIDFKHISKILNKENFKKYKKIYYATIPLGISSILDSLVLNGQKIILSTKIDLESLGIYSALIQLIIILQIFMTCLGQLYLPKLSKSYISNRRDFYKYSFICVGASLILGVFGIVLVSNFGGYILNFIFNEVMNDKVKLLITCFISGAFLYLASAIGYIVISMNRYKLNLYSIMLSLFTTIIVTALLIEPYGLSGAAMGLILGYSVRALFPIIVLVYEYYEN